MSTRTIVRAWIGCWLAACGGQSLPDPGSMSPDAGANAPAPGADAAAAQVDSVSLVDGALGSVSATNTDDPRALCVPGRSVACACTSGQAGAQVCNVDSTYGLCVCTGEDPPGARQLKVLQSAIVGTWTGSTQAFGQSCSTTIAFSSDGHYSAHSPSDACIAFYYGTNDDAPEKTYALNDVNAAGEGLGEIAIYFGPGNTNPGELKHVALSQGGTELTFEAWKSGYGPIVFSLRRSGVDGGTASDGGAVSADGGSPTSCPCTRRPGAGNAFQCPAGVGQSASMTVGQEGGRLSLGGQQIGQTGVAFSLEIPPTALNADTLVTVTETSIPPPREFVDYSPIYVVDPPALMAAVPTKIVIGWTNNERMVAGPLAIYAAASASGVFERVPDSYVNAGFMQGSTKQLGAFFAGYLKNANQVSCP